MQGVVGVVHFGVYKGMVTMGFECPDIAVCVYYYLAVWGSRVCLSETIGTHVGMPEEYWMNEATPFVEVNNCVLVDTHLQ
jgi:hypothetical protein